MAFVLMRKSDLANWSVGPGISGEGKIDPETVKAVYTLSP